MISLYLILGLILLSAMGSLVFSTLTYSLRDFSRAKLEAELEKLGRQKWYEPTTDRPGDLIVSTATVRLIFNTLLVVSVIRLFYQLHFPPSVQFILGFVVSAVITLFCSVTIPHVIAQHTPERLIAASAPFLNTLRLTMSPLTTMMRWLETATRSVAGVKEGQDEQQIEQEILSAVEEGAEHGVVDAQEREIIESVIEFRDTQAGQIMSARPEIIGLDLKTATLSNVKQALEESGHSRLPVYEGTLDHIVGILYARDLLQHLGQPPEKFDIRSALRPAIYVPRTKPLRDLLRDFKLQKVHIAIVLDEYGGTAGLITIEDVLEELVGEISDEHEGTEPAMVKRIDEQTADVDARIYIGELNRVMGLNIPEDAGYDTLGGFISTTLGKIPATGTTFENNGVRYTITDAEPQKVNRAKIQILAQPQGEGPTSQVA